MNKLIFAMITLLAVTVSAQAYVGPGLATGVLSTILGILGSILLAIFAIVWYPLKKLYKKLRGKDRP